MNKDLYKLMSLIAESNELIRDDRLFQVIEKDLEDELSEAELGTVAAAGIQQDIKRIKRLANCKKDDKGR